MRSDIVPGGVFPDYELPDHTEKLCKLSELQGDDPLILTLARGHYCPKEHQQHLELAAFYSKIAVAYTQIVTISTDEHHTLQEFRLSVGAGSSFLDSRVREGDVLDVSAPRGSFTLRSGDDPVVLISAGVGATPVMAMLHALASEKSQRQIWWIYGARNRAEHLFAEESRSLLKRLSGGRSYVVYSKPAPGDRADIDFDASGHVDADLLQRIGVTRNSDFYLCGPPSFLASMRDGLQKWGAPAGNVHTEIFGALESMTPGMARVEHTPHIPQRPPGPGLSVSFARSGITTAWDSKYQSLLELAEACDIPVRWSCRTGVCHSCMTGLITGSISYNPEPLEKPAAGNVLLCCAQPDVDVVLDA